MTVIVSGASGWMGQSFCRAVSNGFFPFQTAEIVGLTSRKIEFPSEFEINFHDYSNYSSESNIEGYVHLAFLTRDNVSKMPLSEFIEINKKIIDRAAAIIRNTKPRWVALVSSGAIFTKASNYIEYESKIEINPYGFLKLEEEKVITEAADEAGSNLAIGRLWGATGYDLPVDPKYAISDFIESAISQRKIVFKSEHEVFRKYCDASEFMEILVRLAMNNRYRVFNSGGPLVELSALANEIASQIGNCKIVRNLRLESKPDYYYPKDESFEALARSLGKNVSGLSEQVSRTISGHRAKN